MTRDCVREDVREVKRALISGGIQCVLWGLAAQMPTALIRAANEELRTVTLTWRIPTRTCLGLPLAAIAAGRRGGVAQLVRASACHAEGRGFESRHSRHSQLRLFLFQWLGAKFVSPVLRFVSQVFSPVPRRGGWQVHREEGG